MPHSERPCLTLIDPRSYSSAFDSTMPFVPVAFEDYLKKFQGSLLRARALA